mmetsp:Transcript_23328/g.54973  ORF Transcript_23328/g.54973 Transcript_23328/m.54973 type:complete len:475 (+) Transcript_23328:58-1482(+)
MSEGFHKIFFVCVTVTFLNHIIPVIIEEYNANSECVAHNEMRIGLTFRTVLLMAIPSLASAAAVHALMFRGGGAGAPGNEIIEPDLGHGGNTVKSTNKSSLDDKYVERIVQSQWQKHRRWARVAAYRKRVVRSARVSKLGLVSLGAVCQVAATQVVHYKSAVSCIGGICIMLGTYIKNQVLTDEAVSQMVESFATSQAIRSEVYKFRANVTPYNNFVRKPDEALNLLRDRCNRISSSTNDHRYDTTNHDKKPAPGWLTTADDYIAYRIEDMINRFYKREGKKLLRRYSTCHNIENVLLLLSAAASSSSTVQLPAFLDKIAKYLCGWTGAATTVSTAFATHMSKGKFKEIAIQYYDAADELRDIRDSWPSTALRAGSADWEKQVMKSEEVIYATIEEWAQSRSNKADFNLSTPEPIKAKTHGPLEWAPGTIVGTDESGFYPAKDRAAWLMENQGMSQEDAQNKVIEEFPDKFKSL